MIVLLIACSFVAPARAGEPALRRSLEGDDDTTWGAGANQNDDDDLVVYEAGMKQKTGNGNNSTDTNDDDENEEISHTTGKETVDPVPPETALPTTSPTASPTDHAQSFAPEDGDTEDDDLFKEEEFYRNRPLKTEFPPTSFTILAVIVVVLSMIFSAWQMSEHPDGVYASLCRLIISFFQLICRILTSPCRRCLGHHEPYGHIPVSTMEYGYKDPPMELSI